MTSPPLTITPPNGLDFLRFRRDRSDMVIFGVPLGAARRAAALSPAERDVVAQILEGRSNADIARARGTSPRTVANQIQSLFRKLGVGSRAELAVCAALYVVRPG